MLQSLVTTSDVSYVIYGREVGEQGTPHLQIYLETGKRLSLSTLKSQLGLSRIHLEKSRGSAQSNREYCTKEDNEPFEDGTTMSQGKRTDLDEIKELMDDGATANDIADSHFSKWVVYRRSFIAYKAMKQPKRDFKTFVHVLHGKTGTGKSRWCFDQTKDQEVWRPGDYKWFDGYDGQDIVIIDDYRGEYDLPMFLNLCDQYPMQVPVKGGFVNWRPKTIYITSNVDPDMWYETDGFSLEAFRRRLSLVQFVTEDLYDDIVHEEPGGLLAQFVRE